MKNIFDFGDISRSESAMRDSWDEFRQALANKEFNYTDVNIAKTKVFLKVFDDMFSVNRLNVYFTRTLAEVIAPDLELLRGAIVSATEILNYDRFLPKAEFIRADNRFSPKGIEWLYLTIGCPPKSKSSYSVAEHCSMKECHVHQNDRFAICRFKIDELYGKNKIVDLTISSAYSYASLNSELEVFGKKYKKRGVRELLKYGTPVTAHRPEFELVYKRWCVFTYAKMLAEQIFRPIETAEIELVYAPFQCLSQYFLSLGYDGIIYGSTVYPHGKNIVLFDKKMAVPVGPIKDIIIK